MSEHWKGSLDSWKAREPNYLDDVYCDICGEPKRHMSYQRRGGGNAIALLCEQCEADEADADQEADDASQDEAAKLQASFERAMSPDLTKTGIFQSHHCWKCQDGAKPCVEGRPGCCSYPHARND